MSATPTVQVHPARAEMDRWRAQTPRPVLLAVHTERMVADNGSISRARLGLNTYSGTQDFTLSDCENHLHAAMEVLPNWGTWRLISPNIMLSEGVAVDSGDFIFERVS